MGLFDFLRGPKVQRVAAPDAHRIVQEGAQFIDVRNRNEYKSGHAAGAKNIALNTLPNRIQHLDRDRPVVCICQSGARSGRAAQMLAREGFDVYNVHGGSMAWQGHRLPWE